MDTNNNFYKKWFKGVNSFIKNEPKENVDNFLTYCAESCSASYSLSLYKEAFEKNDTLEESLEYLKKNFPDFNYRILSDKIEIIYRECGCDLYEEGFIDSPRLCCCSEKSLHMNWGAVYGMENVTITNVCSILKKDNKCVFEVKVKQLGHFEK